MRFGATVHGAAGFDEALESMVREGSDFLKEETAGVVLDALTFTQSSWTNSGAFSEDTGRSAAAFGVAVGAPYDSVPPEGQGAYTNVSREIAKAALQVFDPLVPRSIFMSNSLTADTKGKPAYPWYLEEGHHDKSGAHVVAAAAERAKL